MNGAKETKEIKKTPGRIGLNKRIAMKCLDCAGNPKEITLCHLFDCPLWAVRFGHTMQDTRYQKRMKAAENHYHKDFEELQDMGIDMTDFYRDHPVSVLPIKVVNC